MDTELAYLAGFLDGEGCISIGKSKGYYGLMVYVAQINPAPLALLHRRFGGYVTRKRDGRGFRSVHQWHSSGREGADVLRELRPFLIVKSDEADLAISFQERMGRAVDHTPEAVAAEQQAREEVYQRMKALKRVSFDDADLPRSKGPGRPKGQKVVRLTAGRGTGPSLPARQGVRDPERLAAMQAMRRAGDTLEVIGQRFGIKKAAVSHMLRRWA